MCTLSEGRTLLHTFEFNEPVGPNESARSHVPVGSNTSIGSNEPVSYNDSIIRPMELFGSDEHFPFGFNDLVGFNEPVGSESDELFGSNESFALWCLGL